MREDIEQPPRNDPAEALMRKVGAQLRAVREERGEALDEVARYLRIRQVYLYGIERGDMTVMPGRTYALGFLRTYADYLDFDGEDLIEQIRSSVGDLTGKTRLHIRSPLHESRLPKMPLLVLSFVMVVGVYAGWTWLNRPERTALDDLPPLPGEFAPPLEESAVAGSPPAAEPAGGAGRGDLTRRPDAGPAAATAAPDAGSVGAGSGSPAAAAQASASTGEQAPSALAEIGIAPPSTPEGGPAAAAPEPAPAEPAPARAGPPEEAEAGAPAAGDGEGAAAPDGTDQVGALIAQLRRALEPDRLDREAAALDPAPDAPTSAVEPSRNAAAVRRALEVAADEGGTVYEAGNLDARVILRARGQSWMQISSVRGDYVRTHTLNPGDTFLVPNRGDLMLWTGNAGGLEILVDGEPVRPLGPDGRVMRDIPLEPSALLERARRPG